MLQLLLPRSTTPTPVTWLVLTCRVYCGDLRSVKCVGRMPCAQECVQCVLAVGVLCEFELCCGGCVGRGNARGG